MRVARQLAQARERLERAGVAGLQLEHLLVDARRALGRADVLGQDARALHRELDAARVVARHACACFS